MTANGRRVALEPAQEAGVEVELDGKVFRARSMTRSAQKQVDLAEKALNEAKDADELAERIMGVLDALVDPAEDNTTPGSVLREMWDNDRLSLTQLSRLMEDLSEAAQTRPT